MEINIIVFPTKKRRTKIVRIKQKGELSLPIQRTARL
jgi:hypothetical protein